MTIVATAEPSIATLPSRWRWPRGALWLTVGLYSALALTLIAPLAVTFLWSMVDPKAGWFAPDILPRSLSLHHWKAAANDRGLVESIVRSLGGFKRSSQHSKVGGCDEHSKAAIGTVWKGAIIFTRTAACGGAR